MTLAILIIGLVIATCFIAYIADNIGKNLGKKRISIFGLRPRQTATLISMASSVAIMLLTVGIIMATSASVRNALTRYDAEKRLANQRLRDNQKLLEENQALQRNFEQQSKRITSQLKEIERNREVAERSIKERRRVETLLESAGSRLETARRGADDARKRLASARRQFQTYKKQLDGAKAQVAAAKERVQRAQSQVQAAQTQLQNEQGRVASTRNQLVTARREYSNARKELSSAQTRLGAAQSNFRKVRADIAKTREDLEDLQAEVAKQQLALRDVRTSAGKYEIIVNRIGIGDIATPLGELFAESTLPAGMSAGQIRAELRELMQEGRSRLTNPPRTLKLAMPPEAVRNELSEDEFLNGFAAYLSTLNAPVSLRLLSARGYASIETEIFARLTSIVVRTIYARDEVLETATIDAAAGDAAIFNRLLKMVNDFEQRARDRGVTPLLTPQNPYFYPAGTNERIFEALRKIQSEGGSVPVRLIAAEDITSVESPRVRFEVGQPVETEQSAP